MGKILADATTTVGDDGETNIGSKENKFVKHLIVDSHHHFWQIGRFEYPWLTPQIQVLRRDFLPEDLTPLLRETGVDRTVVVQAHQSLAEAHWLLELAAEHDFIAGVVVWSDLAGGRLANDLDQLQRNPKFKGLRHMIQDEPDDAWMIHGDVLEGFRELERRDIPFDVLIYPRHLKLLPKLREQCPRLRLVIDHIAKPPIARGEIDPWARALEVVASLSRVWCKLSGMITEANWQNWTPQHLKPYVQHVVHLFGYDRLMFGSDWPVCTLAGSYQQVISALRECLGPISRADADLLWGGTARSFYRLD
jgi:L-fucono-1,5-lactonase